MYIAPWCSESMRCECTTHVVFSCYAQAHTIHTSASLISSLSSIPSTVRHPWLMLLYKPGSSLTRSFSKGRGHMIWCWVQVCFHFDDRSHSSHSWSGQRKMLGDESHADIFKQDILEWKIHVKYNSIIRCCRLRLDLLEFWRWTHQRGFKTIIRAWGTTRKLVCLNTKDI